MRRVTVRTDNSPEYVRQVAASLAEMQTGAVVLSGIPEPIVADGQAVLWRAVTSGTKDSQSYAVGDVLLTSVVGTTSKTVLLMDWSAV